MQTHLRNHAYAERIRKPAAQGIIREQLATIHGFVYVGKIF